VGPKRPSALTPPAAQKAAQPARGLGHDISHFLTQTIPAAVLYAFLALALLAAALAIRYHLYSKRAGRREKRLHSHIDSLQEALIPELPAVLGQSFISAAYAPASGPGAGGDFYDAFELDDGRVVAFIGDVAGHGREALARTAFIHYGLRTWLKEGAEPRVAIELASRVLGEDLGGLFCTALICRYDPASAMLTWASAGHPPPILTADVPFIKEAQAPPIGMGLRTGMRQTSAYLPPGTSICLHTDGLTEARGPEGLLGGAALEEMVRSMPREELDADSVLGAVRERAGDVRDDMAALVLKTPSTPPLSTEEGAEETSPVEEMVVTPPIDCPLAEEMLSACGVSLGEVAACVSELSKYEGSPCLVRAWPRLREYSITPPGGVSFPLSPFGAAFTPAVSS
jgi:serine phosphatase RsbU (regulator of sigma subunit)